MKDDAFRRWLQNIWFENREEYSTVNQQGYSLKEYFNQNKYWLKNLYQYQKRQNKNET